MYFLYNIHVSWEGRDVDYYQIQCLISEVPKWLTAL